jgi:hypothetical protein
MTSAELTTKEEDDLTLPTNFFTKTIAVTIAIIVIMMVASYLIESFIDSRIPQGGPAFWKQAEQKLYSLADEQDLPLEKKQQIIKALNKLALKYQPYLEALTTPPPKQVSDSTKKSNITPLQER